jgi:hypothetical protein
MLQRWTFLVFLFFFFHANSANATISQVDGTIVPVLENCEVWAAVNHGEGFLNPPLVANTYTNFCTRTCTGGALCIDAQRDADIYPQVFLPVRGRPVLFVDLMEQAGYENTFGWYNVGNPYVRYPIFTCTPTNHEPFAQISVDFDAEFAAGRYDGGLIAFYIITPQNNAAAPTAAPTRRPTISGTSTSPKPKSTAMATTFITWCTPPGRIRNASILHLKIFSAAETTTFPITSSAWTASFPLHPRAEICDGRDNNCNGAIDDDPIDAGGACGTDEANAPPAQWCAPRRIGMHGFHRAAAGNRDGLDNDCSGVVDDNLTDIGDSCGIQASARPV